MKSRRNYNTEEEITTVVSEDAVDESVEEVKVEEEKKEVPKYAPKTFTVVAQDSINVREGAGTNYAVVKSTIGILRLTETKLDDNGAEWGRLADGSGYVMLEYTTR